MTLLYPDLSKTIYDCAFEVHKQLGPGLLESAYEVCLEKELTEAGMFVERQKNLPVPYKGIQLDVSYRVDLFIDRKIIIELKSVESVHPLHTAQLMTYLKLTGCHLGFLINFNVVFLKEGIKRYVL